MGYPKDWKENPPEVPPRGEKVSSQLSQFAAELRKQSQFGTLQQRFADWLYDFEEFHPPAGGPTFKARHETTTTTTTTDKKELVVQPPAPVSDAAQLVYQEGRRIDRLLESVTEGLRELRIGFATTIEKVDAAYATSIEKLSQGVEKLNEGYSELRLGYAQQNADYRSFLGVIFPHVETLHKTANDSMEAYRKATIREAEASSAISSAAQASGGSSEAEKAIIGLLSEAAKEKLGLNGKRQDAPPVSKTEPKKEPPP